MSRDGIRPCTHKSQRRDVVKATSALPLHRPIRIGGAIFALGHRRTRRGVAATRLIGDRCFLNVPLPFAAVRASGCSVPAWR